MANRGLSQFTNDLYCVDQNWSRQLEIFKIFFDTENLFIKYIDSEDEEIGLNSQQDYDYALQFAAEQNDYLNLLFKDQTGKILSKNKFFINKISEDLKSNDKMQDSAKDKWIVNYLEEFKQDIMKKMDEKIKEINIKQSLQVEKNNEDPSQIDAFKLDTNVTVEEKVNMLLKMLNQAFLEDRPLKKAYLEEELQLTGAFDAEFVSDVNMPDGTKFPPNREFQKQWLIKNKGKLSWNKFPIQLVCIAGNISTLNEEKVNVAPIDTDSTVQVNVNLASPSHPGEFYTEWALVCNGFQFGPRLWCSIQVEDVEINEEKLKYESCFSEDDEFVVVPDCFDLTKKWKPDYLSRNEIYKNTLEMNQLLNENEDLNSKFEQLLNDKPILEQSNNDSKMNINTETDFLLRQISIDNLNNMLEREIKDENCKVNEQKSPSSFTLIKDSLGNLSSPTQNISDTVNIIPGIPLEAKPIKSSQISSINTKISEITSAIGSLGSLYQYSDKKKESNSQSSNQQNSPEMQPTEEQNMDSLIKMGFANRALNKKLLTKYKNDMDQVIGSLLKHNDNDWFENR